MRTRKVIIPAAGMGTRFLPATKALPKEMLPIVDKPSIQYVLEEALEANISDVMVITGRGKRALEDHFDTAYELERHLEDKGDFEKLKTLKEFDDISISYTRQSKPLGLGHAVLQGEGYVGNEPFAVMLPDDIISDGGILLSNMIDLQERKNCTVIALIEVSPSEVNRYGMVAFQPTDEDDVVKITDMVEKPKVGESPSLLAVAGRYIIKPEVFSLLKTQTLGAGGEIQLTDALKELSHTDVAGGVYGIVHRGRRFDTGDKLGYLKANIEFALQREDLASDLLPWITEIIKKERKK